jgi:hypothetical protein
MRPTNLIAAATGRLRLEASERGVRLGCVRSGGGGDGYTYTRLLTTRVALPTRIRADGQRPHKKNPTGSVVAVAGEQTHLCAAATAVASVSCGKLTPWNVS